MVAAADRGHPQTPSLGRGLGLSHEDRPDPFVNPLSRDVFLNWYSREKQETWAQTATRVVTTVCAGLATPSEQAAMIDAIYQRKLIPAGRYLANAGREINQIANCFAFRAEDSREGWGDLLQKAAMTLMLGGGIGINYSAVRAKGLPIKRTGGVATGPLALMNMINECGRGIVNGGNRRSAIWAGLAWDHPDVFDFLKMKNHAPELREAKERNINFPLPMELTNVSVVYDADFFAAYDCARDLWAEEDSIELEHAHAQKVWAANCLQAFSTAEPGFAINFRNSKEDLHNAPVSADTWVLTDKGYTQIRDIVGVRTPLWTGQQFAPATFKRTKTDVSTVIVEMTGRRSIKADPTHEFKVERWTGAGKAHRRLEKIESIPAAELEEGDILHVALPRPSVAELDRRAYTLGFLYGDGHFSTRSRGYAQLTLCTSEKKACLPSLDSSLFTHETTDDARGYHCIYMKDELLADRHRDVFPADLTGLDKASFIAGLFDADGCASDKRLRLGSTSESFMEGTRRCLETLGIVAHISNGGRSSFTDKPMHQLVVAAGSVSRFAELIPTHRVRIEGYEPFRASHLRVLSVRPGPVEDVFCCDVGVDEHTFCAEGVIISNCTEFCTEDDSDRCNLGTVWMNHCTSKEDFAHTVRLGTLLLMCGGVYTYNPTEKIGEVARRNNRIGLGLGGMAEWLLRRGEDYEVTPEMHEWLAIYRDESDYAALELAQRFGVSEPKAKRAIAPNGTISFVAETTTGIEPLFASAYKRRYHTKEGWKAQYVVDGAVKRLMGEGVPLELIERSDAYGLTFEQRVKFQADVQDYVDMAISSTCNVDPWGSETNNESNIQEKADILMKYARRLRGFTVFPDGCRGGQPLTKVSVAEALQHEGTVFDEKPRECVGGICGL